MKHSAAIAVSVERARAAIRSIVNDGNAAEASDALQEIGVLVIDEIESLSPEAEMVRAALDPRTRRKSDAR